MRRKIIGGAAGRRGDQYAVADQFIHAHLAVHRDPELGGLVDLAEQRHLVDGERLVLGAVLVMGSHTQGVDDGNFGLRQPLLQAVLPVVVEEEADRPPVHAVDRDTAVEMAVHGLEHQPVAAKGDDSVSLAGWRVAVELDELLQRSLRLFGLAGDKGDFIEAGHPVFTTLGPSSRRAV